MSLTTEQASILANIAIDEYMAACHATDTAGITRFLGVLCDLVAKRDPAALDGVEQYRLQMAGISTAAIGYWKEGDGILPDYDTVALRDVAKLYVKYDALYKQKSVPSQQEERKPLMEHEGWEIAKRTCGVVYSDVLRMDERLVASFVRAIETAHNIKEQQ